MADHKAASCAGETAVSDQGDGLAEARARQCASDAEHFSHSRTTAGTFIANDQHVAWLNLIVVHGGKSFLFGIEDARRPTMLVAMMVRNFHYGAFRREISAQNGETAGGADGIGERTDNLLPACINRCFGFLSY